MLLNNINEQIIINIVLIIAAILIVIFANKVSKNKQEAESIIEYNTLFETLIEINTQPTLIVDNSGKVQSLNTSAAQTFGNIVKNERIPNDYYFINNFMKSSSIHLQIEININDGYYLVSMSKFHSRVMGGAFITFTDITYIKEAQELQGIFMQNVSHELKTPISAIQGICELLLDDKVQEEEKKMDFVSLISKENERLKSIVANLTQNAIVVPVYSDFRVSDLFKEIELFFSNYHGEDNDMEKNINLIVENNVKEDIRQDEKIITQILINLVSNAYKYTDNGTIKVSSDLEGDDIVFSVVDTGIGMKKTDLSRIFKRFYRVDKSRSRKTGGTGLGLSIVQELVETLGGSIEVYSELETGSEFVIKVKNIKEEDYSD